MNQFKIIIHRDNSLWIYFFINDASTINGSWTKILETTLNGSFTDNPYYTISATNVNKFFDNYTALMIKFGTGSVIGTNTSSTTHGCDLLYCTSGSDYYGYRLPYNTTVTNPNISFILIRGYCDKISNTVTFGWPNAGIIMKFTYNTAYKINWMHWRGDKITFTNLKFYIYGLK